MSSFDGCNDLTCEHHQTCMLWAEPVHPQWIGFSLRPYELPLSEPCPWFTDRETA